MHLDESLSFKRNQVSVSQKCALKNAIKCCASYSALWATKDKSHLSNS